MNGRKWNRGAVVRCRGLSLIEVAASLAIIGLACTTMLAAHARSLANVRSMELQITAQRLAEELLSEWRLADADVTTDASGAFESAPWRWSRSVRNVDVMAGVRATLVEFEVIHSHDHDRQPWTRVYRWLEPKRGAS